MSRDKSFKKNGLGSKLKERLRSTFLCMQNTQTNVSAADK